MATSLTFLPAMLGFLGPRALSRRERAAPGRRTARQPGTPSRLLAPLGPVRRGPQGRSSPLAALAAVVAIALPIFGLRLGTSDASTDPAGWTTHQAYTALAHGFGPGFNGPLELAAQAGSPADATAFGHLLAAAAHTPGVASVTPARDLTQRQGAARHRSTPRPARRPARPSTW